MKPDQSTRLRTAWLTAAVILGSAVVFAIDVTPPHGDGIAYAYILVVLIAALARHTGIVMVAASLGIGLTALAPAIVDIPDSDLSSGTFASHRTFAVFLIAFSAGVATLLATREREAVALGRALKAAELDRDTERRMLAAASEISEIGTWSINDEDDRFDWSDTAAAMHGKPPGFRPTRDEVLALMAPEDANRLRTALDLAWRGGVPFREELRLTLPDGSPRWVLKMGETVRDGDDEVARLYGTVQDITPWKQAELSAKNQRERFTQLARSLPIIVWTADPQGNIEYFNDALSEYTGSAPDDLLGDKWVSAVDPRDLDNVVAAWTESLATGKTYDIEYRVRGADGVYRWHHLLAQPERNDEGSIIRWWGSSMNIDSARRLRDEADKLAAERETILESMNDGVYAIDGGWRIIYVNSSAEHILSRHRDDMVGHVIWELFPEISGNGVFDAMARAMGQGTSERVTYHSEAIGKWLELSVTRSPAGVTVFIRDITDIRLMSDRLAQSQRLEAVGQLTGGIAHDFNNLLTVVLGGADALFDDDTISGEAHEMAQMIAAAAERGAELTHRLLAFARRQPLEPRAVDLAARLLSLEPLLRRTLGEHVSLVVNSAGDKFLAEVDPGQYDNALLNLAINARDAMPHGGSLTIEVDHATFDEAYVSSHSEVLPGAYIVTSVTDSGEGISPGDIAKLFDPFFTTKEMGQGSGLGLAMVWGFVKQSRGHVTVYSEPGQGSIFKIYLPAAMSAAAPEVPAPSPPRARVGSGKILVAEDDELVRQFATDRLRAAGYEVITAGSGSEALEALDSMDRIDLLFTDVIMPGGMTGRDLADALLERRPGTPVLYASGYTENVVLHNGRLDQGVQLLAKPYSAQQLLQRVGELILPPVSEES